MDDNSRRRRRDEAPYPAQGSTSKESRGQGREFPVSSSERFHPVPAITSPSSTRVSGGTAAYAGYYQESTSSFPAGLPTTPQQFQSGYPQDQRQQAGFSSYNPDLMYNASQQATQSAVYDSAQQFQARQSSGMQMLPEVPGAFFQNEPSSASGASGLQHHISSSTSMYSQQSPASRNLQQGFPSNLTLGGVPQSGSEAMEQEGLQPATAEVNSEYALYQTTLRETFQNIINGRLSEASQSLLGATEWLLGHVEDLDDAALHSERIQLWDQFNAAWLSIAQKQKDMLESGQRIRLPHSLMTQERIKKMVNDLHGLCDGIAKHGLVDYQYGVAENDITTGKLCPLNSLDGLTLIRFHSA
ncbi:hypothetical protein OIDMADRAFT_171952 [Oidiodendron maius Zn]|uniref:Uncharacterized protein n=1 Tax=Oidiodendron maius (strain Zn) TaxID=913774 RepID=A0A0C3CZ81_OIDMZ|nr:hypothetical protein OIDMADRAFT_171952 [Oidiodendron maius Zn]